MRPQDDFQSALNEHLFSENDGFVGQNELNPMDEPSYDQEDEYGGMTQNPEWFKKEEYIQKIGPMLQNLGINQLQALYEKLETMQR